MIIRKEIISDADYAKQTAKVQENIELLLLKLNKLRAAYGKPLTITSGFRTMEHHLEIYAAKGITDKKKIPMKSRHLTGQAVDISDVGEFFKNWILTNMEFVEQLGLYFEDFAATPTWVHIQIVPPASGNRFFKP